MKKVFRYSAFALGLVLSGFFIMMSLDSFPASLEGTEILGFLIHMSPGLLILTAAIVGLFRPRAGIIFYFILFLTGIFVYKTYTSIQTFILVSLPMLIILILLSSSLKPKPEIQNE